MQSFKKTIKAQVISEFSIILSIAILAITSMTFFIQRGLQARLHDARVHVSETLDDEVDSARWDRTGGIVPVGGFADVLYEYEPYYQKKASVVERLGDETVAFKGGDGTHTMTSNSMTTMETHGEEAPAENDFWDDWEPTVVID